MNTVKPKNQFQEWLESKEGQEASETSILSNANNQKYLENRLWFAYTAGMAQQIKDNPFPTPTPSATVQERADAYAKEEGYYQSDKEVFETTPWTIYNKVIAAYVAGAGDNVSANQSQAQEIERLKEENKALTEALEQIINSHPIGGWQVQDLQSIAKTALNK